jgi:hypothetical protein
MVCCLINDQFDGQMKDGILARMDEGKRGGQKAAKFTLPARRLQGGIERDYSRFEWVFA